MGKRYFIELSREDIALVSYFPGLELKDNPDASWINDVLLTAIEPIGRRKNAKIRGVPITFWIGVRRTARRRAEIFLFMTPDHPEAVIEKAIAKALLPIRDGKVHAGRERLPDSAFPCLQMFRGKIIRFYNALDGEEGFYIPTVVWEDGAPAPLLLPIPENDERLTVNVPNEEAENLLIEAQILPFYLSTGDQCRSFQQALIPVAREVD